MGQVVDIVVKSSKTPISAGELSGRHPHTEFDMTRTDFERDRGVCISRSEGLVDPLDDPDA